MTNPPRNFKGIWIPAEVWLDQRLTYFERCLLAEIHSLNGEKGCFASNEYFSCFFDEKERKIQDGLAKLKSLGYIYQENFNGRQRFLRTNLTPDAIQKNDKSLFSTPEVQNQNDKSLFSTPGVSDFAPLPLYIDNKEEKKDIPRQQQPNDSLPNNIESAAAAEKKEDPLSLSYQNTRGDSITIRESDIYRHFIKMPYETSVLEEAIERVRKSPDRIGNIFKYIEAICHRINNTKSFSTSKIRKKPLSKRDDSDIPFISKDSRTSLGEMMKKQSGGKNETKQIPRE